MNTKYKILLTVTCVLLILNGMYFYYDCRVYKINHHFHVSDENGTPINANVHSWKSSVDNYEWNALIFHDVKNEYIKVACIERASKRMATPTWATDGYFLLRNKTILVQKSHQSEGIVAYNDIKSGIESRVDFSDSLIRFSTFQELKMYGKAILIRID